VKHAGILSLIAVVSILVGSAAAADPAKDNKAKSAKPAAKTAGLTVAVLNFASSDPANPDAGGEIAAALTAMLSGESGITLVERDSIMQTLREHELNLTGLVNDETAIKVGKLVGAKIMVTGRAFRLGKDMFITAKLIGTETSLIESVMVKDTVGADLSAMVVQLSKDVAEKVRRSGPELIAGNDGVDPLPALKKKLAGRRKPVVSIIVREQHHAAPQVTVVVTVIDPAVETEIKKVLTECGFTVQDVPQNELTDFAHGWAAKNVDCWPRGMAKVDVLIAGEAFSEFAVRIGNIVSCSARAEINVVNRKDGKVVLADRVTTRAADLSENIAAKKALQSCGHAMAIRLLEHFTQTLPEKKD